LGVALCLLASTAQAQERPRARIEVDAGGALLGGAPLGSGDANLLANNPTRQSFRLFSTETDVGRAPALHVRAARALSRRFGVEGGVVIAHPEVRTSVGNDAESAPPLTVVERIDQYFFEASLVVMFEEWRVGAGTVPFAVAGGGYLRQLHEGLTVIEQGHLYHAGGGVKHWFVARTTGVIRTAGLRADARMYFLARGLSFDEGPRPHAAISGSVFVGF
jgi:hypothetical protein